MAPAPGVGTAPGRGQAGGVRTVAGAGGGASPAASRVRRWGVLVLAVGQLVAAAALAVVGGGQPGGGDGPDLLITPAGWAFAIWGLVVAGCLAYAAYQLPARRGDTRPYRQVAWPLIGVEAGFVLWLVLAEVAPSWTTFVVFAGMLALLVLAYGRALRDRRSAALPGRVLLLATLGVYTGWSAVAVPVNLASALAAAGLPARGAGGAAWQAGVLVVALGAGLAVVTVWRARAASTAAVLWALVGVAVGADSAVLGVVAGAGALALAAWAAWVRWDDLRRRLTDVRVVVQR